MEIGLTLWNKLSERPIVLVNKPALTWETNSKSLLQNYAMTEHLYIAQSEHIIGELQLSIPLCTCRWKNGVERDNVTLFGFLTYESKQSNIITQSIPLILNAL